LVPPGKVVSSACYDTRAVASFLRATAVPAGTAERILAMAILSVCPSVCLWCHETVPNQAQVR